VSFSMIRFVVSRCGVGCLGFNDNPQSTAWQSTVAAAWNFVHFHDIKRGSLMYFWKRWLYVYCNKFTNTA